MTTTIKIYKNGKVAVNGGSTLLSGDLRYLCGAYLTEAQWADVWALWAARATSASRRAS